MATLYHFQAEVDRLIRAGRSVIIQAPTGAGKTRAALFPFLDAWRDSNAANLPRQCMYAVPLRTLANQFQSEYAETVQRYTTSHGLREVGGVSIQTGSRPEDRKFEHDLIFLTIDQLLSSFLTIPYSLGNRQANLNAGAIIGSYLVFDEFHLFPVDESGNGALATTLHMLKMLKGITPFVLMTATFSTRMLEKLCVELDAEAVTLTPDEVAAIPSQQGKQRLYRYTGQSLTPAVVATDFVEHQRQRAIAVCNTVDRARALAAALQDDPALTGVRVELLHSQFYASGRDGKETDIRSEFGEDMTKRRWGPTILVATQVVEVGLNITCDVLHTEMAPASAIIQRAGRCARFARESGTVLVYDVPLNEAGRPNYAPYIDSPARKHAEDAELEGQSKLCERTQAAFAKLPPAGKVLHYHDELALVNEVHEPFDERLLSRLHDNRHSLREAFEDVFRKQDRTAARDLIRDVDSRTVIVHPDPNETTLPNPYRYEGISVRRSALLGWFTGVQEQAAELDVGWIVKLPVPLEATDARAEGPEQRRPTRMQWERPVGDIREACRQIAGSSIIVVNPALVQYDLKLGFRFEIGTPAAESPLAPKHKAEDDFGPIHRETYAEHIHGLYRVYATSLRDRTAATRRRLEQRHALAPGTLDQAIRLMFAAHDLGKLDRVWQAWAHNWQTKVSELRGENLGIPQEYMAAHTDYDSSDKAEWRANKDTRPIRPPHAAESARAARELLEMIAGDCDALYVAAMTAIMCHHSSTIRTNHGPFTPAPHAHAAFVEALRRVDMDTPEVIAASATIGKDRVPAGDDLSEDIIDVGRAEEVVLYLFLARILRLADQKSQEYQ